MPGSDYYNNVGGGDDLVYAVQTRGFDTSFWKDLGANIPTVVSNKIRINDGDIQSYSQYKYGIYEFAINFLSTPSSGEAKVWGLRWPNTTRDAIYFEVSGSTFQVVTRNDEGTATTTTVTWNAWEGSEVIFRFHWTPNTVTFTIDNVVVADHNVSEGHNLPSGSSLPLPLRLDFNDAENIDTGYVAVRDAGEIIS